MLERIERDHRMITRLISYLPRNLRKKYGQRIRNIVDSSLATC